MLWRQAWPVYYGIAMALGKPSLEALEALVGDRQDAEVLADRLEAYAKLEEPSHGEG